MRSPQTIGDDQPWPGITVFHRTLFVVLHVSGGVADSATPIAPGPRNCGHPSTRSATACWPSLISLRAGCSAPPARTWHVASDSAKTANMVPRVMVLFGKLIAFGF